MDNFQRLSAALLAEIGDVVKNLLLSWDGAGAMAHAQAHRKWAHGAAQMDEALTTLHQCGAGAHHNYTRAAETNRGMWS
jgi:uncharacterized protein YukE